MKTAWKRVLVLCLATANLIVVVAVRGSAQSATSNTLELFPGGIVQSTVAWGTAVTLSAWVTVAGTPVTVGRVQFCETSAAHCASSQLLGTAQLTSSGTASLTFVPAIGMHGYYAQFLGTKNNAGSSSSSVSLTVTGLYPTTSMLTQSGSDGNYTLSSSVTGMGGHVVPTGKVSFLDASNGDAVLGTGFLEGASNGLGWQIVSNPMTGSYPQSIAIGDFNGDGIPDLAVANTGSGTVSILLGNGDGTFTQAPLSPVTVGSYPFSLLVADFNGDGIADLAVTNYGDGTLTVLLGRGNGSFQQAHNSPIRIGANPTQLVTGDFNGDGIADLAAIDLEINGAITILLGAGDGTFSQAAMSPIAVSYPNSLAVADFSGDGIADLAEVDSYGNLNVFLGNGDGTFAKTAIQTAVGDTPISIAADDFNGDGITDLAIADYGSGSVSILLGQGGGTFAQAESIQVGSNPVAIAVGDFNGDGIGDLAVVNAGSASVSILLGNRDGTFSQASASPVFSQGSPLSVAVGDFNGDGISDLAVAGQDNSTVSVLETKLTEAATATVGGILPAGAGVHEVFASYSGDGNYNASNSGTQVLRAQLVTPVLSVATATAYITSAENLAVTVGVNGGSGNPTTTGTVTLTGDAYTSSPVTLENGGAVVSVPAGALGAGNVQLVATYLPDANSSSTYNSSSGSAFVTVTSEGIVTPTVSVQPSWSNIAADQNLTVTVQVIGGNGAPVPTGTVTVISGQPPHAIYGTFQYPDGTLINGLPVQSGNAVWKTTGDGIGVVKGLHLVNVAPIGEAGTLYALLANTSTENGAPQPITTIGGTLRLCPSATGTYDLSYSSVGMIASHDQMFIANFFVIGIGPTDWWFTKTVNGVQTLLATGPESLQVDCTTEYTVQMIINQAAGTIQAIPPNGTPTPVITDPDVTNVDALYGAWEPENDAPNHYIGEWGSVWLGGAYVSESAPLSGGSASITIPGGSLVLGAVTLTASYAPDATSAATYNAATGTSTVTVNRITPLVTVSPSLTSMTTTQSITVTVGVSGGSGNPVATGAVVLSGGGYTSAATNLNAGSAAIVIPAGALAVGSDTLTAAYTPDTASAPYYTSATGNSDVTVSNAPANAVTPLVTLTPLPPIVIQAQNVPVSVAVSGGNGAPTPGGTVMLMASNSDSGSFPVVYDTFQYPDGASLAAHVAQSGNSTWSWTGGDNPTIQNMHVVPEPDAVNFYYVSLANTTVLGGTPSPVTALGASFQLCPSPGSSSYDANQVSMAMLAQHDTTLTNFIHLNFSPTWWSLAKRVNGGPFTVIANGEENLAPDCTTTYSVEMLVNAAAGTVQMIRPNGMPTPVITDPDITVVNPLYGTWETGSGATCGNCAFASIASVWMGGGYLSPAEVLSDGTGTFTIPPGALPLGADTLTASYTPDAASTPYYSSASQIAAITVNLPPGFTLAASPASLTIAEGGTGTSTVTVTGTGGFSGNVTLSASGLTSGVTASFAPGSTAGTQILTLSASLSAQITSSPVTVTIIASSQSLAANTTITLSITSASGFTAGSGDTTSITVTPGSTTGNTGTISVVGTNGFIGTVNLNCAIATIPQNFVDAPTCTLNPAAVTISGTAAQTSTLKVMTTGPSNSKTTMPWPQAAGTALALLLLRVSRKRNWLRIVGMLLLVVASGILGCDGGGANGGGGGGISGTTPGSYTITVTGSSGSLSATIATITLTVQ